MREPNFLPQGFSDLGPQQWDSQGDSPSKEKGLSPSGMVWCPMKMSEIATMKCAEYQAAFGCGATLTLSLSRLRERERVRASRAKSAKAAKEDASPWPWLRRHGVCPTRATEEEIREARGVMKSGEENSMKGIPKPQRHPKKVVGPSLNTAARRGAETTGR